MTVYARGYRRYGGGLKARRVRFMPIVKEGVRDALRSRGFRILGILILVMLVLICFFLYFQQGPMSEVMKNLSQATGRATEQSDATVARGFLAGAIFVFHGWFTPLFVILLTLFVGAGLIADDIKSRALPLYLIRPLTPLDYFLGKFSIPMTVLALAVLLPGLVLVLMASLMRPTGQTLEFLMGQGDIVLTLLLHYLVLAASYTSVVLLASTWTGRRIGAIVLGAVLFFGGDVVSGMSQEVRGPLGEWLRSASLRADSLRVLTEGIGGLSNQRLDEVLPTLSHAFVAPVLVFLLCAWTVMRRARTTEVTA